MTSKRSLHGLDWLNFFLADVRTGVGPFIAIYLTGIGWDPARIGVALTAAEFSGVLTQAPGGALTDRIPAKRLLVAIGLAILTVSSLMLALFPGFGQVIAAQLALGATGSIFGPGVSAITLGLIGYACLGARTGRNAAFGSAGNIIAALTMGYLGYRVSTRAIFYFVALLSLPTLVSLLAIRKEEIDLARARGAETKAEGKAEAEGVSAGGIRMLLHDRRLLIFAIMTIFFHLGNGAMLAQMGEVMTKGDPKHSSIWMGAIVTVAQCTMAITAAPTGILADKLGRKPVLLFGFIFLPVRAVLCIFTHNPYWLASLQVFDGLAAGIFGIVGVLMIADMARGSGNYNLALGVMGAAVGVGAAASTTIAGLITDRFGFSTGFLTLAVFGIAGFLVLWLFMPETRTKDEAPGGASPDTGECVALSEGK